MTARTWHDGPPPHVGWWNASIDRLEDIWRWWDGKNWGWATSQRDSQHEAGRMAKQKTQDYVRIEWNDYYPANARVPRINPNGGAK